jgi:pseudaminic acid cytidylyltransferase
MNICVIPARGGSKRIPRKNIKKFNGKPIIAYSIEAALGSSSIDQVIVSTDDEEISKVAKEYGAQVPFVRPEELSNDHAVTNPVIAHAIKWMEDRGSCINSVCCLYATAPFVQANIITDAYEQFREAEADFCFSVTSFPFPIQRAIKIIQNNKIDMFYPEHLNTRSQDLEEAYHDAGQFYWGTKQSFDSDASILSETVVPYILPRHLVQDIDTVEDWIRAEMMYKVFQQTNKQI